MLDLLFNPEKAKRHPREMFLLGFLYTFISVILGVWVFGDHASLAIVFLIVLSCIYTVQGAIKMEEKLDANYNSELWVLKRHTRTIQLFLALFFGFLFAFSLTSLVLPTETVETVFEVQHITVESIHVLTGDFLDRDGAFFKIVTNNFNVVLISLVFSIFYGAGAIYILVWNASVMGLVIGTIARNSFGIIALPASYLKYLLHGIPEIAAYVTTSLAGGILYFAIIKRDLINRARTKRIIVDILFLLGICFALLLIAGLIEVFISSLI